MSDHVIKFKYLRNCLLALPDGSLHPIPASTVPFHTSIPERDSQRGEQMSKQWGGSPRFRIALTSEFDLDKIHEVPLKDETPYLPVREAKMSEKLYSDLCDESYKAARKNREHNEKLRETLLGYARPSSTDLGNGKVIEIPPAIELISDEFGHEYVAEGAEGSQ